MIECSHDLYSDNTVHIRIYEHTTPTYNANNSTLYRKPSLIKLLLTLFLLASANLVSL